ncbi:ArsR/SmtB family transcription factor [Gandjariella thermophila]|uniref:Transcriptional regulator n=1 Tax=Gandjariella thermophila TaxID=1931992 RepID=A0A4D4J4J1_9PSEU|nr:metalloregulator ArsR/SmtB family transcription factor [Gandjariella thermophila]GDY31595.1 transcriptional regulator [Gandjariella thermophila]
MIVSPVDPPESPEPLAPDLLQQVAGTFGMLSATARLQIVWLLATGERDVGTLAAEVGQSVATVSQHLAKLKLAGLVRARREGRRQVYLVENPQVVELVRLAVGHHRERPDGRATRRSRGA